MESSRLLVGDHPLGSRGGTLSQMGQALRHLGNHVVPWNEFGASCHSTGRPPPGQRLNRCGRGQPQAPAMRAPPGHQRPLRWPLAPTWGKKRAELADLHARSHHPLQANATKGLDHPARPPRKAPSFLQQRQVRYRISVESSQTTSRVPVPFSSARREQPSFSPVPGEDSDNIPSQQGIQDAQGGG